MQKISFKNLGIVLQITSHEILVKRERAQMWTDCYCVKQEHRHIHQLRIISKAFENKSSILFLYELSKCTSLKEVTIIECVKTTKEIRSKTWMDSFLYFFSVIFVFCVDIIWFVIHSFYTIQKGLMRPQTYTIFFYSNGNLMWFPNFDSLYLRLFTVTIPQWIPPCFIAFTKYFPLFHLQSGYFFSKNCYLLTEPDNDAILCSKDTREQENYGDFDHCKQPSEHQ
jgi:hypothetical protein